MNLLTFLILLLWLACGILVFRFVKRTGGFSEVGRVAHWFGGAFVMFGLAIGMIWLGSLIDSSFGRRVNVYVLTHQVRAGEQRTMIDINQVNTVTVFRRNSVNYEGQLIDRKLSINENKTIRTSLWWMLWSRN